MYTNKYVEAHGRGIALGERNDCAVIALSIACGVPYDKAYAALKKHGRKDRGLSYDDQIKGALRDLGWAIIKEIPVTGVSTKTIEKHQFGQRCLVSSTKHISAMVDGTHHDWSAGSRKRVRCVYVIAKREVR